MNDIYQTHDHILVFRTNINRKKHVRTISPLLNGCDTIKKWNVDLSDIDNVLRIEATHSDCAPVIELVKQAGYACEELTD
ncbi:hypothetical protein [Dyadobacter sp. CY323]|uniref:hypothetical protein n=1 Tax=Dyadobacter sp. CY323 TaxID=2907302 RepID=UPI001F3CD75C|nr:hypothetical protein [Dyadobacter sp. CY323]MCE6990002.1 hypothetical protein [Dyadobacter sp. CY323]